MSELIYAGDTRQVLKNIGDEMIDTVVTSPPYFNLRDYGVEGQIGLEPSPNEYIEELKNVFSDVRRVLVPHGSLWLNVGDSYSPNKNLMGIPWRLAFALQDDGWWLRSDVIWHKTNALPSSVKDRPTTSHEYLFLLTKQPKYYFDADAIREPAEWARWGKQTTTKKDATGLSHGSSGAFPDRTKEEIQAKFGKTRNCRSVWSIPTKPFKGAHFATMPPALVERCLKATAPKGGTVLDPFMGAGTTLVVAKQMGLDAVGIELNSEYVAITEDRLSNTDSPCIPVS